MRRRAGRGAAGATATAAGGLKVAANHTTGHCRTLHGSSDRATGDWHHLRVTARRWVGRSAALRDVVVVCSIVSCDGCRVSLAGLAVTFAPPRCRAITTGHSSAVGLQRRLTQSRRSATITPDRAAGGGRGAVAANHTTGPGERYSATPCDGRTRLMQTTTHNYSVARRPTQMPALAECLQQHSADTVAIRNHAIVTCRTRSRYPAESAFVLQLL